MTEIQIRYNKDKSLSTFLPLNPNPDTPLPIIPVQGFGDMFKSVYDQNNSGKVDSVDNIEIANINNLQTILENLASTGGGGYVPQTFSFPVLIQWVVNHNLSRRPAVEVYTSGGLSMFAEILHLNTNTVLINFDSAISGFVIIT